MRFSLLKVQPDYCLLLLGIWWFLSLLFTFDTRKMRWRKKSFWHNMKKKSKWKPIEGKIMKKNATTFRARSIENIGQTKSDFEQKTSHLAHHASMSSEHIVRHNENKGKIRFVFNGSFAHKKNISESKRLHAFHRLAVKSSINNDVIGHFFSLLMESVVCPMLLFLVNFVWFRYKWPGWSHRWWEIAEKHGIWFNFEKTNHKI